MGGTEIFLVAVVRLAGLAAMTAGSLGRFVGLTAGFTFIGSPGGTAVSAFLRGAVFFSVGADSALAATGLRLKREDNFSFTLLSVRLAGALAFLGFSGFIPWVFGMTHLGRIGL